MKPSYCTQNNGKCKTCSLVNYGRDCQNNPLPVDFLIRRIPPDLWREYKHWSVDSGCSLRELVLEALKQFINQGASAPLT